MGRENTAQGAALIGIGTPDEPGLGIGGKDFCGGGQIRIEIAARGTEDADGQAVDLCGRLEGTPPVILGVFNNHRIGENSRAQERYPVGRGPRNGGNRAAILGGCDGQANRRDLRHRMAYVAMIRAAIFRAGIGEYGNARHPRDQRGQKRGCHRRPVGHHQNLGRRFAEMAEQPREILAAVRGQDRQERTGLCIQGQIRRGLGQFGYIAHRRITARHLRHKGIGIGLWAPVLDQDFQITGHRRTGCVPGYAMQMGDRPGHAGQHSGGGGMGGPVMKKFHTPQCGCAGAAVPVSGKTAERGGKGRIKDRRL